MSSFCCFIFGFVVGALCSIVVWRALPHKKGEESFSKWKGRAVRDERYEVISVPEMGWLVYDRKKEGFLSKLGGDHIWKSTAIVRRWCLFSDEEKARKMCKDWNTLYEIGTADEV